MPGWSDYSNQNIANYMAGSLAMPALPSVFLALLTAAFTADAGTGGTEVSTSGTAYARQQIAGPLTTNATTASGNNTLHFASVPSWIVAGMQIRDATSASVIPAGTTVSSTTSTTVVMSANATGAGVGGTDVITFSAFAAATASSGSNAAILPGGIANSSAVITYPQATLSWGTVLAFAAYDAVTSGNLLWWDWLGAFKWLPFTCTSASPGVLTSPAHGYSNGDSVVVQSKYGGTLPTTGGSWTGALTVANVTTDTFTAGVNTTGTGDGQVRKIIQQAIAANVTASFSSGQLSLTDA
jgi:hypothetical protein